MKIKNIIFDLGGVILNIDYHLTINAFKALGIQNFDELYTQAKQSSLFDAIETGQISPELFFQSLKKYTDHDIDINDMEKAWNAMLLDLPTERIELLKKAKSQYNTFLLSNTNEIHFKAYKKYIDSTFNIDFDELFQKAYYSYQIGLKKPDNDCFNYVLEQNGILPEETLFIDDSIQHIEGAQKIGINTHHLVNERITDLFSEKGLLLI